MTPKYGAIGSKVFKPAFLGRMVIVPNLPVRDEVLRRIIHLKLGKIQRRLWETHRTELAFDESLVLQVATRCTEVKSGARNVDNILTNTLLPEVSKLLLQSMAAGNKLPRVGVHIGEDGNLTYDLTGHAAPESVHEEAAQAV